MTSHDKRPRLDDILSSGSDGDNFAALWDTTEAAGEREPLPAGKYRCLIVNGELAASQAKATPSYKVTFEVIEPADFAGRKVWLDFWLTPKALAVSKRDLAKLRIHTADQLRQSPPIGILADVKVACRTGDDGTAFNRVVAFTVVGEAPPDALLPEDAEVAAPPPALMTNGEGNTGIAAVGNRTTRRSRGKPDLQRATGDAYPPSPTTDVGGFDWGPGEQR